MRCSKCGSDNRTGRKFCASCGAPLVVTCFKCGAVNQPEERFCGDCGAGLAEPAAAWAAQVTPIGPGLESTVPREGERKTVTALFADIKGSTELMRDLDPEEARAVIDPVLQLMMDAVHRYDGHVVQSAGDGIFALFGAPVAHEDHPQRAVHAAIAIRDALRRRGEGRPGRPGVEVRIGINTGEVVLRLVHTGGHTEYAPVGHAANLAARMQSAAPAGGIVISEDTQRLVEGYFELRELGPTEVKGLEEPINVYEVIGTGPLHGHFDLAVRRGLTKFVGRERELQQLARALELARGGHGQIVAVVAEAGTGKSRLFYEFKATLPADCKVLEAYSVSHGKASAWLPVLELLRGYFGIQLQDDPATRREKVRAALTALDPALPDTESYLFALLAIAESPEPLAQMDPQIKRKRTMEVLKRIALRESLKQPVVIIFEDLHWIDDQTQALLDLLADGIANSRVLMLMNYRPEYRHEWGNKSYYTQLRLDPLGRESTEEVLAALLGNAVELAPLKRLVAEKTGGNPFFIEEMVQAMYDQGAILRNGEVKGARPLAQLRLPPTVQGILASRIDRLGVEEKELLQTMAVMGRESSVALIRKIASYGDGELEQMLSALQAGEFIYEQPAFPDAEYAFKHALTQKVAYASILIERRKLLHESAGDAIESLYAGRLEECCEVLAHHYSCSANTWKAVRYLHLAGQQAMRRSAHSQGIDQFHSSLELLQTLPISSEHIEQEIVLQIDMGIALGQAKGYSSLEAGEAFVRARELCQQFADTPRIVDVLWGLWYFYFARAEHQAARDIAEQCMAVARRLQKQALLVQASSILGGSQLLIGDLTASGESLEYTIRRYDSQLHGRLALRYGQDPKVSALCPMALVYWHLGYPDQAMESVHQGLNLARALSDRYCQTFAHGFVGWIHLYRGEARLAEESAEAAISLSIEHGFPLWLGWGKITKGRALAELGKPDDGIDLIYQGLGVLQSSESELQLTFFLALLAQTQQELGLTQQRLATLHNALKKVGKTGERYYEPELYRLRGELLLKSGDAHAAEVRTCYERALELAREQNAKSWELRATISLARLLDTQGRRDEALTMLSEIYNWFTEGFDTADLKEARALLEELGG
jgi:class 3 adenylate cyclase/predicted ATPase